MGWEDDVMDQCITGCEILKQKVYDFLMGIWTR